MFQYLYSTKMTLIFDDNFKYELNDTLDKAVNVIEMAVDSYGFTKADVIDSETGELLIQYTEGDINMNQWVENAHKVENVYGGYVDWEEKFYQCPNCGEPVYEDDWDEDELTNFICPICEDWGIEEDDEDYESEDYDW